MRELVFLLEEESAKVLIQGILPRLGATLPSVRFIVFDGKQDLMRQLERKLRAYLNPEARFIILRDKDSADCVEVKAEIRTSCERAGKGGATIRIACHEIESWYLADLDAVGRAYGKELGNLQSKEKFRDPDALGNPVQELKRLVPEYDKVSGSRALSKALDLGNRRSRSFYHFMTAIAREAV